MRTCRQRNKGQAYVVPQRLPDNSEQKIEFTDFASKVPLPFYLVGDCESYFTDGNIKQLKTETSEIYHKHNLMAIGYKVNYIRFKLNR